MRNDRFRFLHRLSILTTIAMLFGLWLPAATHAAATFTLGSSTGTWAALSCDGTTNIVPCEVVPQNPGPNGDQAIRWGSTPYEQSGLGYKGSTNIPITEGTPFDIGTLWHYNYVIAGGSDLSRVGLSIKLSFTTPSGLISNQSFTFEIEETDNAGSCQYPSTTPCADAITFPVSFSSQTFTFNGRVYQLQIVGFKDGSNNTVEKLISQEGTPNSARLVANIVDVTPNMAPVANAGAPVSGDEGSAIALNGSATDPDLDAVTAKWTYAAGTNVDAGASCVFGNDLAPVTTITCNDDGVYSATLTATDPDGLTHSDTTTVMVANVAPTIDITSPAVGALYKIGDPVSLMTMIGDQGANDTHTCTLAWDDGPASSFAAAGTCDATHTFGVAGVYTIAATITDDDTASATDTTMVVVYDPNAGFVTGGGTIDSPAGAYAVDPSLVGRANFGFVSKYKKGATVPEGQTEFQFKAGSLNFHSGTYEWLVVSGAKAQFKGTGTINGSGEYGFLLTATDGALNGGGGVDKFRIKIWDKASGSLIYDNATGASDDIDAANPQYIATGSIVIHSAK